MDEKIPDEHDIGNLLTQVKPTPSPEFDKKMVQQPWNKIEQKSLWFEFTSTQTIAAISIVALILIGFTLFSPNLNTLARQITQFFSPTLSSQVVEAIKLSETRQPKERFILSISDAEKLAGFNMKRFSTPLQEFNFTGAYYDELRKAVILEYSANSGGLVLRFSQQILDSDYQGIDPQADVEKVAIGNYNGEYVTGGWRVSELESKDDPGYNPNPENAFWDPKIKLQTLRWTDGYFLYEILLASGSDQINYFDKEELVQLAEDLH